MNRKQRKTLEAIFKIPTNADIEWKAVQSLMSALGAKLSQGRGSRIRIELAGVRHILHVPHPGNELPKYAVENLREFLMKAGIQP